MKKSFLIILAMTFMSTAFAQTMIYQDDFEAYAVSSYIAVQSPVFWQTWTNSPGSAEDAQISNDEALTPTKSLKITTNDDLLLLLGDKTTGKYEVSWSMFVRAGMGGYYNIQHFQTPGIEWANQVFFELGGSGRLEVNSVSYPFIFQYEEWFQVQNVIDLDNDVAELWINGSFVHTWPFHYQAFANTGTNLLGSVNFYGYPIGGGPLSYIDDVRYMNLIGPLTTSWTGGNSTDNWFDPLNWDNGIPSALSTVVIPPPDAPITIYPMITSNMVIGDLQIQGNASGSGSVVGVEHLTITNPSTVQRYYTGGNTKDDPNAKYHFISSPVFEPTTISAFPGESYIRKWNESAQEWVNLLDADVMQAAKGYTLWIPSGGHTASFVGTINSGDHVVSGLSYTAGGPTPGFDGYNLVGNPFPSGLDWDIGSWVKTNIDATIAIWNGATGNYYYWNGTTGSIVNGVIPLGHGFFVKASAAPSLTIPADAAVNPGGTLYKDEVENLLSIQVSAPNGLADQIFINFNDDATTAYDAQYDGQKMYGLPIAPQIFTLGSDGTEMAINTLPYDGNGLTMPLHLVWGEDGTYTLTASDLESFNNSTSIYLEDMKTGGMINLMDQATYNFDYTDGDDPVRFTLHFDAAFGTSEMENESNINVYAANHNIYLTSDETLNGEVYVYNLMGQIINTSRINGNSKVISMTSARGQYIVRVISAEGTFAQKVFVK